MGAVKIDGTAIAKRIRENLHAEIQEKKKINPRYIPSLKIIQGILMYPHPRIRLSYTDISGFTQWATAVTLVRNWLGSSARFYYVAYD